MTPAQINRELMQIKNIGTCTIFTIVYGQYAWYLPMFTYLLKKAYPEYKIHILADTNEPEILAIEGVKQIKSLFPPRPDSSSRAAAIRFLYDDDVLTESDYTLITDCDMLMIRESISIVDQHMLALRKNGLECYNNYLSNGDRCPGIHFVTKEWWARTEDERDEEARILSAMDPVEYDHDEKMLLRIIRASGLPEPKPTPNLWAYHGQHLGEWRRRAMFGTKYDNYGNTTATRMIASDPEFMQIAEHCNQKAPVLRIVDSLKLMMKRN